MMIAVDAGRRLPSEVGVGSFGDKFRQERERRGITLDAVSNTTKISARMLKAIEDEHFDQLPGGVFNKGFIRAYARQIGLDEEQAVTDYLAALREGQIQAQSFMPEFRPAPIAREPEAAKPIEPPKPPEFPKRFPPPDELPPEQLMEHLAAHRPAPAAHKTATRSSREILLAALVLFVVVVGFLTYRRRGDHAAASAPVKAPESQPVAAAGAGEKSSTSSGASLKNGAQPSTAQPASQVANSTPPAGVVSAPPASGTLTAGSPAARPDLSLAGAPSSSGGSTSGKPASSGALRVPAAKSGSAAANSPANSALSAGTHAAATSRVAAASSTFKLVIRAEETSWVSITADGRTVAEEILIAPAGKSILANEEIVVKAGNAGGLTFVFNDKPLPKQGASGEVRTFIFNGQGMRVAASGQGSDANR